MKSTQAILSLVFTVSVFTAFAQTEDKVSIASLLNDMVDRDAIARFPKTNFRLEQESSYNRASKTPADSVGWFTNKDFNSSEKDHNFIRIEEKNGKKEWVLMDYEGPGAIVRTWMPFLSPDKPDTDIQIKIYLDGNPEPVLQGNMLGLLDGTGLIPYPLAHQSLRSAVSFFPIPFAKGCKITTDSRPFFYQFTYRAYREGTQVETFTKAGFDKAMPTAQKVGKLLLDPENHHKGKQVVLKSKLGSKEGKSVKLPIGNAAIRVLSVKLKDYKNPEVMRSVVLKIEFDGEQTVWSPIGDFFGSGIGLNPFQGWYRTVSEDGTMTCRWVMPYQKSGKISVVNFGDVPIDLVLKATVGTWEWDDQSMYFNAAWRGQYPVPTRPFSDWNYVTLKGRGVYVGDALTVMNPVERWWGEGDEKIWVDGEDFPSIFGTGTEDYYAYSWGGRSTDFYEHPFHAQPRSYVYNKLNRKKTKEKNTLGYSTETRTRALDIMPFETSLKLDMEVWSWTDCEMGYGVGMYWYGDKQTTSNRAPDEKEVLNVPPLPKGFPSKL
ncbi:glycoside hydrolase family 172 protein [Zobellia galactanivorans]|nr:glycoside hydrolase family 172 protein [Zobellia galactanivorans]